MCRQDVSIATLAILFPLNTAGSHATSCEGSFISQQLTLSLLILLLLLLLLSCLSQEMVFIPSSSFSFFCFLLLFFLLMAVATQKME